MTHRAIDEAQAVAVLKILFEDCGFRPSSGQAAEFVRFAVVPEVGEPAGCGEYRFQGKLGFGGKFRNNGNFNNTPYVDCYGEDETAERREMINRANARIAALFVENKIVGYEMVGDERYPIMSGPCKGCGATRYGISTSGPDYCGACACGVPPEESRLRRELESVSLKYTEALLALQIATGFKVEFMTPQMKEIGTRCLDRFTAGKSMHTEG